ncbi:MAG TPA: hypothetical protein VG502_13240 [Flexivirga sp.]|uniref:hypothetical protein n=1 Tax=Flexivirga sp. TaxID=1962927 RepID=UPI002C27FC7C|nr:hypothetical protein [Flexivirga sp.]HWC23256.1 hypothetical protein [Flexivirga sp.]
MSSRMTGRKTTVAAGVAIAIAVTVPAYTAYAAGTPSAAKPTASKSTSSRSTKPKPTPSVTPYSPPAPPEGAAPPTAKTIKPSGHFAVRVDRTGKKPMDNTWPSATGLFTRAELQQVIPGLTDVSTTMCRTGNLPDGGSTTKSTTCTLNLRISGESDDDRSKLMINIRGFGLPQQIGKQWTKDLAQARARSAKRPGLYTFYPNKSLGTSAAYTDGTTTKVLVQHGDVAGEIWFSGIGFTTLDSDYLKSRRAYRTAVVPSLVQLLGAKFTTTAKAAA